MTDIAPDIAGNDLGGWKAPTPGSAALFGTDRAVPKGKGHPGFLSSLDDIRELHLLKSGGYGSDDDPFANFTAVAAVSQRPRYEYPMYRMVEKITRIQSLIAQGRTSELAEEFGDIAGLSLCALAMLKEDEPDA